MITRQHEIEGLRAVLGQLRAWLAMLHAFAPDYEMQKRIREAKIQETVVTKRLMELGVKP